jgi:hypothetical protein
VESAVAVVGVVLVVDDRVVVGRLVSEPVAGAREVLVCRGRVATSTSSPELTKRSAEARSPSTAAPVTTIARRRRLVIVGQGAPTGA